MKAKIVLWCCTVLMVFGCTEDNAPPPDLIPKNEMISLMIDIYEMEAKILKLNIRRDSAVKVFEHLRDEKLSELGIPDSTYLSSMSYYMANPEIMSEINEAVVDSLNLTVQKIEEGEKKKDEPKAQSPGQSGKRDSSSVKK